MDDVSRAQDLIGSTVYDQAGSRIGRVDNVYLDDATNQPEWVTVRIGFFGTKESFVPLAGASTRSDGLTVTVPKDKVKTAPRIETEQGHLSTESGHDLYTHYGLRHVAPGEQTARGRTTAPEQRAEPPVRHEGGQNLRDELVGRHRRED
ncbi:PRC-barrel domain-containing protein [Parasphingorhabdus pacifica]